MTEFQAVVTVWVTADDQDHAAVLVGQRVDLPHRVERVVQSVTGPQPGDEETRLLAWAYEALGKADPAWKRVPIDDADKMALQLLAGYTAEHGSPPASAADLAGAAFTYTQAWASRSR